MSIELPQKNSQELIPEITLQEATAIDITAYIELEKKVASKTYFSLTNEDDVLEEMSKGQVYFIKEGNKIIGNISYQTKEDGTVFLSGFGIDPEYQGKGLGRKALELILIKAKNAPRIELATHPENNKAINLYLSLGFVISGKKENFFGDGEARLVLTKIQSA